LVAVARWARQHAPSEGFLRVLVSASLSSSIRRTQSTRSLAIIREARETDGQTRAKSVEIPVVEVWV